MAYTFSGGIHVEEYKNTRKCRIETLPPPKTVIIPLSQHIGAPAVATVIPGEEVTLGQKIGNVAEEMLGCPVHSSVSGKVREIVKKTLPTGASVDHVVIENDMKDTPCPDIKPIEKKLTDVSTEEIVSVIREAGIVGMGGAAFPTYAKINSALGKVDRIIINCAECEPFITANHRLLLEHPASVINGIKILLKALGVHTAWIAVEDNKPDAIEKLEELTEDSRMITVKVMKTKYPQGDERQLIYALTGQEIPTGKLPADVGCVIFNAETCAAVYKAFANGTPSISRVVTVDGDCIKRPKNLLVPVGTPVTDLVEFCGGLAKEPYKLVSGGPMMGMAQWDPEMPVTKSTSAVLLFSERFGKKNVKVPTCIHCGRCVNHCPMHLMPMYIAQFSKIGDFTRAEEYGAMSCVECGSCSYNCPGGVEIVQHIRVAKAAIKTEKARLAALNAQK
ncbi:MAG: electron transport complex subunit RsxC [Clostridiales bacterium]|nr:electron transport complex subunit RsxC [Clostridiales bacterium]